MNKKNDIFFCTRQILLDFPSSFLHSHSLTLYRCWMNSILADFVCKKNLNNETKKYFTKINSIVSNFNMFMEWHTDTGGVI